MFIVNSVLAYSSNNKLMTVGLDTVPVSRSWTSDLGLRYLCVCCCASGSLHELAWVELLLCLCHVTREVL